MKRILLLLLCILSACLFLSGCASSADIEQARRLARYEGYEEGHREGYDSGYEIGYDAGFNDGQIDGYNKARKTWNNSSSGSSASSEKKSYAALLQPSGEVTNDYVLNTNSNKFHYAWCSSVYDMAEHNKKYYTGTREEIIDMGFIPCKRCNP